MRRNADELAKMRRAGRVVAEMHEKCVAAARPGVTTADLDAVAREVLDRRGARSNFLNYHGFPAVICTSPNDVIVHGIPGDYRLEEGDIISLDCGAIIEGYHGDAAVTVPVGQVSEDASRLMKVTDESLQAAIAQIRDGNRLSDIGHAVQTVAEDAGYSVVREYVGHGIGTAMHEEPQIPNYGPPGRGIKLRVGHVSEDASRLMKVTSESLQAAIAEIRDGNRLSDIGHAVQTVAEGAGYSVVREYVGHGIGTAMHEEPQIPNYGPPGRGIRLRLGHVFAVEPMVNMGGPGTKLMDDGWTVKTADGSLSAHFEHTIAVTEDGPEVLTVAS